MKKGFTLVEMLIVVVVLVTLMSITFRLSSISSGSSARATTIAKMQKLENCLSGYYAAFGSYPPVKQYAKHNIYLNADDNGVQDMNASQGESKNIWTDEAKAWRQVKAVCLAQPVACRFPPSQDDQEDIEALQDAIQELSKKNTGYASIPNFTSPLKNSGHFFTSEYNVSDWSKTQLFQFGLMSYLLPRFLTMTRSSSSNGSAANFLEHKQWTDNNKLPRDPYTDRNDLTWQQIADWANGVNDSTGRNRAKLLLIPSQAVCARWMANLEGVCDCSDDLKLFGINIKDQDDDHDAALNLTPDMQLFGDYEKSERHILMEITVTDGYKKANSNRYSDFYYYSPYPYQTYTLWSAGSNGKTFPPWMARDAPELNSNKTAQDMITDWIKDDIIHMSN